MSLPDRTVTALVVILASLTLQAAPVAAGGHVGNFNPAARLDTTQVEVGK